MPEEALQAVEERALQLALQSDMKWSLENFESWVKQALRHHLAKQR